LKVAYVIHRYGPDIWGGAEAYCRAFATRLVLLGVDVDVYTTCATDYKTWRDVLPPGVSTDEGVTVRRFRVAEERAADFDEISPIVLSAPRRATRELQEAWMRKQGPLCPELVEALAAAAPCLDLVIFVTYLYGTTYFGLPVATSRALLHPTAHDEPPIHLPIFDEMFRLPRGFCFATDEERDLVERRFGVGERPSAVVGIGFDPPARFDADAARARRDLPDRYAICLGRIDPSKGIEHLVSFFGAYYARHGGVELLVAGEQVMDVPDTPGVRVIGPLDEEDKWDLVAGAEVLVHPSYHESFAMNLLEAWSVGTPALVNGLSTVTVGHCRRSNGGVWYRSYLEFEAALDMLLSDKRIARRLGEQGKAYAETRYRWDDVMRTYLGFLERVSATFR